MDSPSSHHYIPATALFLAFLGWIYTVLSDHMSKLPGPFITKFTDIPLKYNTLKGQKPHWIHKLHLKYGPIVRISPYETSVQDVDATQQIYRIKGEFLKSDFYDKIGSGLVNVFATRDVDVHRRQRKLLSGEMAESSLNRHLPTVERNVRLAIARMEEEMQQRHATDVFHWFLSMATDVIVELSFGESFKMLESNEKSQYMHDMQNVTRAGGVHATFPFLVSLGRYISIPAISSFRETRQRIIQYADESLQRHQRIVDEQGEDAKPTLLSKLYKKASEDTLTLQELRNNAQAYIIAGSDTTANTLTYLVWMVCRHSTVKSKLLQELKSLQSDFRYVDIKSLPYLNQVIEETLRLYPAVPAGLPRVVPSGGAKLAGHYIPAGSIVSSQAWSMHRDPGIFPEPLRYDPSRWENPTQAMKDSFVAFGGGSRVCLGLHLARMELRLSTARFFITFPNANVSSLEGFGDEDMEPEMFFLLTPKAHRCLIAAH